MSTAPAGPSAADHPWTVISDTNTAVAVAVTVMVAELEPAGKLIVEAGPAEDMLSSDNPFIRQFLSGESEGPLTMD